MKIVLEEYWILAPPIHCCNILNGIGKSDFHDMNIVAKVYQHTAIGNENTVELDNHYDNQRLRLPKNYLLPCDIFERTVATEDQTMYHVLLYPFNQSPSRLAYPIVVKNIPRDQIAFIASLYTTNMHVKNAFRHEIFSMKIEIENKTN